MSYVYTVTKESVTVMVEGKPITVSKDSLNFTGLRDALMAEDWDAVPGYLTVAKGVESWAKGNFTVKGGSVYCKGEAVLTNLNQRILEAATQGSDPTYLMKFWERLQANPSWSSVTQLFGFLKHEGIPIDQDGCFLAYKSVRRDYMDHHSRTVANTIGSEHEMPRNKISDDPTKACHIGYHVGALGYASTFHAGDGSRIVICKVDPADVVCIPHDVDQMKMRVCKYKVIGHHAHQLPSSTMATMSKGSAVKKSRKVKKAEKKIDAKNHRLDEAEYARLDGCDNFQLLEESLKTLRKYAAHHLRIVGACKIPGGKLALVDAILKVQG